MKAWWFVLLLVQCPRCGDRMGLVTGSGPDSCAWVCFDRDGMRSNDRPGREQREWRGTQNLTQLSAGQALPDRLPVACPRHGRGYVDTSEILAATRKGGKLRARRVVWTPTEQFV